MTREEAINELKILREEYWDDDGYGHETQQYDDTINNKISCLNYS